MTNSARHVFVCSCEHTMTPDGETIAGHCGGHVEGADQLCRAELDRFRSALATHRSITVACTQEQPIFDEVAAEEGYEGEIAFTNIRENAGWSDEGDRAGPKMAALLAAGAIVMPAITTVSMESQGVALVLGRDESAIAAATRLSEHLDVTMLLSRPDGVAPPQINAFPVVKGTIRQATGHLGAFDLTIDDYAVPSPSSRSHLVFGAARNGATSQCDLIVDLTGDRPLFSADALRSGYLRADPRDKAAVERILFEAVQLVGTFDKPRFVNFEPSICAHSRSKITGCTRCLDLCPTGAIKPAGESVAIDPMICAGCGQCAAVCPTGAASYALPPVEALATRLRTLLRTYHAAGGQTPVLLIHDSEHGAGLIDALARFGRGLPAHVLPLHVNEITQIGPEILAAAFAYGAGAVRFLARARPLHDLDGLYATQALTNTILTELGYGSELVATIETDDPEQLDDALRMIGHLAGIALPAAFLPPARKRGLLELAFSELHRVAPTPVDSIPLAAGAPFGGIDVDLDACTLCLSCVSACPANAITDHPDRPTLRFTESLCVQCGLCAATCPEDAITLEPRLDLAAWAEPRRLIKEEEPCTCIECGKAFGTRSTVQRVMDKLAGHWMYSGPDGAQRLRILQMCEDCRVQVVVNESFDPHEANTRRVRTTEDYLREREESKH
jgi:ferredoxin